MKITKIGQVIQFEQGDYLSTWVDFCTQMRANSEDEFSKSFWKMVGIFKKTYDNKN